MKLDVKRRGKLEGRGVGVGQEDGLTHDAGEGVCWGRGAGPSALQGLSPVAGLWGQEGHADRMRGGPTGAVSLAPSPPPFLTF